MKAQIQDGMSGIYLYFDIRYNCDGRFINCTRTQHFTSMEINKDFFPLKGGSTARILNFYFNPLKPNDLKKRRTAQLTCRFCILYIYSTNIRTEYFKYAA